MIGKRVNLLSSILVVSKLKTRHRCLFLLVCFIEIYQEYFWALFSARFAACSRRRASFALILRPSSASLSTCSCILRNCACKAFRFASAFIVCCWNASASSRAFAALRFASSPFLRRRSISSGVLYPGQVAAVAFPLLWPARPQAPHF